MRFIGDVHGAFADYERLIDGIEQSVQIGDMGIGFHAPTVDGVAPPAMPPFDSMKRSGSHRFLRGNQDDPDKCRVQDGWIADGHSEGGMFFCGGALSVNRHNRTEGLNWWPDEELSEVALAEIAEQYLDEKPGLMVTHDCPHSIAVALLQHHGIDKQVYPSRTRHAFQAMLERHSPDIWVFGHWHMPLDVNRSGTRFICLDVLETIDL